MSKVYVEAAQATAELKMELRLEAERDGIVTPDERKLIELSERAYAYSEATVTCIHSSLRVLGGGQVDDRMARQVRDSVGLLAAVAVPAQGAGGGHKKRGRLAYVQTASGEKRLLRGKG